MTKILVIDDDPGVQKPVLEFLQLEGYFAVGAKDGLEGLRMVKEYLPDLILCDVTMPELDGYAVLRAVRQDPATATTPFIFLSGKGDMDDLRQGMNLGADDYLPKPFKRADLLRTVAACLQKQATFQSKAKVKLDELRDSIAMALPHELLTPLNAILGFSEFLIQEHGELEPGEILQAAQSINKNGKRLRRLIGNFLLFSELHVLAREPDKIRAMNPRFRGAKSLISEVAVQKAKSLNREQDLLLDLQDVVLRIEESRFRKIVEELIDNAFKFSPAGTQVQVIGRPEQGKFHMYVIDHGRGMMPEQVSAVGAYVQFERKLHEQQGSGLGLIIAKRLAELHEGELTIQSIPSEQTIVTLVLPQSE